MSISQVKRLTAGQPLLEVGCTLGESPLYDSSNNTLHFVDIIDKKVYHLQLDSLNLSVEAYEDSVTCLAFRQNGKGLACLAAQGFGILEDSNLVYLAKPLPPGHYPYSRFNDGACDSKGRFFAGSIYDKARGIPGKLWRYDPSSGSCVIVDDGPFTDSNGLGFSLDEKILYFTDSQTNIIYAYDYADGQISNRRVFVDAMAQGLSKESSADGLCIDSEGCIWGARWGGSQIARFDSEGKVDLIIDFPTVFHVTACCFGGPNEDQLYVTTAHCGVNGGDATRQEQFPDSGHLFVVDLAGKYKGGKWRYDFAG